MYILFGIIVAVIVFKMAWSILDGIVTTLLKLLIMIVIGFPLLLFGQREKWDSLIYWLDHYDEEEEQK